MDLRKLSHKDLKKIRDTAIDRYKKYGSVAKVSREVLINRQLLYKWIEEDKKGIKCPNKRARNELRQLDNTQIKQLFEVLFRKSPSEMGYDQLLWSVDSIIKLINDQFNVSIMPFQIRRYLRQNGFFLGAKTAFKATIKDPSGPITASQYSLLMKARCYYFQRVYFKYRGFYCLVSMRGDIRFIGIVGIRKLISRSDRIICLLRKIQKQAKSKIIIISPYHFHVPGFEYYKKNDKIFFFRYKFGELRKGVGRFEFGRRGHKEIFSE